MAHTVVVRLTASGRDGRLRGVAEDVPTGTTHRFTTDQELVDLLHELAAAKPVAGARRSSGS
jgi:hypothetical protein